MVASLRMPFLYIFFLSKTGSQAFYMSPRFESKHYLRLVMNVLEIPLQWQFLSLGKINALCICHRWEF